MHERWKVDEGGVLRRTSTDMDARVSGRNSASFAVKVPGCLCCVLGLPFQSSRGEHERLPILVGQVIPFHSNMRCAECDHSPGVLHGWERTRGGVGDGANLHMSCVLDESK